MVSYPPQGAGGGSGAKNTKNLLLNLIPLFTGWVTPPGTNADIVDELTDTLTTPGTTSDIDNYVTYDLGSSLRVSIYTFIFSPDYGHMPIEIQVSDDNATWYSATAVEDLVNNLACYAKTRYVQFHLSPYFSMSITQLKMRVYLL